MKTKSNTAKLLYLAFVVLMGAVIISSIVFMNEYCWIQVYGEGGSGTISRVSTGYDNLRSNIYVFDFFTKMPGIFQEYPSRNFIDYATIVVDFQNNLNSLDNLILAFGLVGLVCVCGNYIFANHSRKVYYISNLISGILFPLFIVIFGIVVLVNTFDLLGQFEKDSILYNIVAVLQGQNSVEAFTSVTSRAGLESYFCCTSTTFYVYITLFIIVICYSLFMIVYTIIRYNGSAERRKEILSRVVKSDD